MQAKTYVGKILVRIGEYENDVTLLVVANSDKAAWDVLEGAAQNYYGDDNTPFEEDGYYANGGEIFTQAKSLAEIGLATFLDLKPHFMVRRQVNVTSPDESALEAPLAELAQALTNALNRKEKVASHSQVLNAVASAYGHKNWNLLRTKLEALEPKQATAAVVASPETALSGRGIGLGHEVWIAQEFARVGVDKVEFIESRGYRICDNGITHGWYALLPGETEFRSDGENQNYLGFFSSLDELVSELLEQLGYYGKAEPVIPDEIALALCWAHNLKVYEHITSVWFSPDDVTNESYATAGDTARALLKQKGIKHNTHPSFYTGALDVKRRYIAEILYDAYDFNATVEHGNGWEDAKEDSVQRAVFLQQKGKDSLMVTFRVTFKRGSAEAESRSVE
jgi:hypothetical protein